MPLFAHIGCRPCVTLLTLWNLQASWPSAIGLFKSYPMQHTKLYSPGHISSCSLRPQHWELPGWAAPCLSCPAPFNVLPPSNPMARQPCQVYLPCTPRSYRITLCIPKHSICNIPSSRYLVTSHLNLSNPNVGNVQVWQRPACPATLP